MFTIKVKIYGVLYNQSRLSLLIKHLVIGQCQKAPNILAFHSSLVSRNEEGSTFTEKDQHKLNYRMGQKRT